MAEFLQHHMERDNMTTHYDAQLVIGPYETKHLDKKQILHKLECYVKQVPTKRLILWNNQGDEWFEQIVEFCDTWKLEPYLWYPVLADTMEQVLPPKKDLVKSATGKFGYGDLGCWDGFVGNDENFLFRCPEHGISTPTITDEINAMLTKHGFKGVFLDRIRYPSPANGLEMLFACFCESCLLSGQEEQQHIAEKALQTMVTSCLDGQLMNWNTFISESNLTGLMQRRYRAIEHIIGTIYDSLDHSRFSMGLDLLSPSLAPLVGQSYQNLANHCDWIKAMTYTKAVGPAGLPLEMRSMINGLCSAHKEISSQKAAIWIETLLGLPEGAMGEFLHEGTFSASVLKHEIQKALKMVASKVPVFPGIELVDHPVFPTRIGAKEAESMIKVVNALQTGLITCWNVLYIPETNYYHLRKKKGAVHV